MRRRHRLPFGAELVDGGGRFRLWAPAAEQVDLLLDGASLPMAAEPDGWFALTTPRAQAGSRYRYRVDGFAVPDPASRFQPDDVYGPSEVIDPAAYDWQDVGWTGLSWEEIVLYELHVGSFSRAGSFAGVAEHLDHLVALGVTAIELMPVGDFPGRRNWGYDGVLPFAPDSAYGRPDDLKRLVETCHDRGLAVFLDVVYNHFGPDGNYLGRYAPGFFTERLHTPWGAAIDFNAAPVRRFFVENALYWLEEFHLDGLRFDAVHAIIDDSPRHILTEIAMAVHERLGLMRPIHLVLENDCNEAWPLRRAGAAAPCYRAQWNDDLHHVLHVLATGQREGYYVDYADRPLQHLGRALAEGFAYQDDPSPYRDGARRGGPSADLPATAFVSFIQNHDQVGNHAFGHRLNRLAPADAVRLVTAIMLLSPAIPLLFMGEEWAAVQPFPFFCDFGPELTAAVREGRRREFARFPEFSDEAARARIPDPAAEATFLAAKLDWSAFAQGSHAAQLAWYRGLLALRRHEIAPRLHGMAGGRGRWQLLGEAAVRVQWQLGDGAVLTLYANFGLAALAHEHPAGRLIHAEGEPLAPRSVAFFLA